MEDSSKIPQIRCRQIKSTLQAVDEFEKDIKDRVLKRISKDTLSAIEKADDNHWMPVAYIIEIVDAVVAEIGEKGVYDLGLKSYSYSIGSSMVGPFFRSALNLFKMKPTSLWKMSPLAWKSVFKNCGELHVSEVNPSCVIIALENLPLGITQSRPYLLSLAGSFHAILTFAGLEGEVFLDKCSAKDGKATFIGSWKRPNLYKEKPVKQNKLQRTP